MNKWYGIRTNLNTGFLQDFRRFNSRAEAEEWMKRDIKETAGEECTEDDIMRDEFSVMLNDRRECRKISWNIVQDKDR